MNRVEAAFKQQEIVPQLLPVAPKESLRVIYEKSDEVNLGEELTPTQVQNEPQVSWDADSNALYTLVMAGWL
uniref:Uncharacterized protein n=1 Tax=Acrobeloides nanus TaxID=290746 RepID=A0A914E3L5_9BILA